MDQESRDYFNNKIEADKNTRLRLEAQPKYGVVGSKCDVTDMKPSCKKGLCCGNAYDKHKKLPPIEVCNHHGATTYHKYTFTCVQ